MISRLHEYLKRGVELWKLVDGLGLTDAGIVHTLLSTTAGMAEAMQIERLPEHGPELIKILRNMIERITVRTHEIEMDLKLGRLMGKVRMNARASSTEWELYDWDKLTHNIVLPIQIKRSGQGLRIMVPPSEEELKRVTDQKMVKLLSKAHDWFNQLALGKVTSIQEISAQENLARPYVSKTIYLAFLAPDIVRGILRGRHPATLTSAKLMNHLPLPIDWHDQRKLLGFKTG